MSLLDKLKALYWITATLCLILVTYVLIFKGFLPKPDIEVMTYEEDGCECAVYESGKTICKELNART